MVKLFERSPTREEGSDTTRVVPGGREMGKVKGNGSVRVTGRGVGG